MDCWEQNSCCLWDKKGKGGEHCGHKAGDSLSCQRKGLMQSSVPGSFTLLTGLSPPPLCLPLCVLDDEGKRLTPAKGGHRE